MKKNTYIIYIALVITFTSIPSYSFALKQAIFPDAQSLQPLPPDIHANISGNVNSSDVAPSLTQPYTTENDEQIPDQGIMPSDPLPEENRLLLWPFIIGLCIVGFFVYRKIKKVRTLI